jgi:hypothetical protein
MNTFQAVGMKRKLSITQTIGYERCEFLKILPQMPTGMLRRKKTKGNIGRIPNGTHSINKEQ